MRYQAITQAKAIKLGFTVDEPPRYGYRIQDTKPEPIPPKELRRRPVQKNGRACTLCGMWEGLNDVTILGDWHTICDDCHVKLFPQKSHHHLVGPWFLRKAAAVEWARQANDRPSQINQISSYDCLKAVNWL